MNQPVQLAGRRRAGVMTALSQGLSQPAPPRISLKAQRFTMVDAAGVQVPVNMHDPQYGMYLDTVIIGANPTTSKIYYEYEYDPTKDEPPTCFSDNGIGPSAQSVKPQSATCAACPNNAWGSDTSRMTGKPTKACNDRKKVAVIVVGDPAQLVYQLNVPPASLKHLGAMIAQLKGHQIEDSDGRRPVDPSDVVTRIYFNAQKQGEILFQPIGYHQQTAPYVMPLIDRLDASGAIELAVNSGDTPYAGALAAPAEVAQLAAPQAFAQPAPAPAQSMQPGGVPQAQPGAPAFGAPQTNGAAPPPAQPAPRQRRGGARNGAGRPAAAAAPAPAQPMANPSVAPFMPQAQPAPAQAAPQPAPVAQPAPFVAQPAAQPMMQTTPGASPAAPPSGQMPDMPPFLMRAATPVQPGMVPQAQPAPAPAQPQGAFGMQMAPPPDPALMASVENAFGAPIPPRQR